jgi:hypothetical protein
MLRPILAIQSWASLVIVVATLGALAPAVGHAQQIVVRSLIDADDDPATGCTVATAEGDFIGAEVMLTTTVDFGPAPPSVSSVERRDCDSGTGLFQTPIQLAPGSWPVGVGSGELGSDVVETFIPLEQPPFLDPIVRIAFDSLDGATPGDALLSVDGAGGVEIRLALPTGVPVLPSILFGLLAGALGIGLAWRLRRAPRSAATALGLLLCLLSTVVWAVVLDGLISDWLPEDLVATDPSGDATAGFDLVAAFAKVEDQTLFLRLDGLAPCPPNACGGCSVLADEPGEPCGPCDLDQFVCSGTESTVCDGNTPC